MASADKHVFLQELREQPSAVRETIEAESSELDHVARIFEGRRIHLLGMGSSYFASLYASYLLAELTDSVAVNHVASEFLHYPSAIPSSDVTVALSQSGESIETVKAVRLLKTKGRFVVGVTNEPKSALARLSDQVILTHAGREKASSTKTFASTLAILYCLIVDLAAHDGKITERKRALLLEKIARMTRTLDTRLESWSDDASFQSRKLAKCRSSMVLARGPNLSAALQGALLFKEVAKIPAEGMSSGEFAHGPIEALSRGISAVVLGGGRTSKLQYRLPLRSKALHAQTIMITPTEVKGVDSIPYGEIDENLAVFPCAVLLELLAYHTALKRGLNPDQFRVIHKVTTRE